MTDRHDEPPTAELAPMDYASLPRPLPQGMAVAVMVLGIIGMVSSVLVFISLPCSILGAVFGEIANRRSDAGRAGGKGMAVAGMITGFVGIFISAGICAIYLANSLP